jgi:hypothetical protein
LPTADARSFHGFLSPSRPASRRWSPEAKLPWFCPDSRPDPIPRPIVRVRIRRSRPVVGARLSDARFAASRPLASPGVFDVKEQLDLGVGLARKFD